jgi:hypothetical protein
VSRKNKLLAEKTNNDTRVGLLEFVKDGVTLYEVISHPLPFDHTIQPSLFITKNKQNALNKFEE